MMNNQSKHVAFYIGSLTKGGAERVFVNLAEYFAKKGYQVTMVTQYQKEEEYELPAGVNRVISDLTPQEEGGRIANFVNRYRKLRRIFKEIKADVVLSTIGKNNFMAIAANLGFKTRVVVSVVAEPTLEYPGKIMTLLAKTLFYLADGIVMQTTDACKFFQKSLQKKCVILKNSMNPVFVRPRYEGERAQDIVAVGRMDENKNHRMVIDAFSRIAGQFPDSRLIFYGKGELMHELKEQAKNTGFGERILFPGAVTDVADRIEKAYAFVLASYTEGMPNTLIEAMSLGLACVSTDCPCGGPKDLITDGENGFLIPVGDTGALADRLARLLADADLACRMGRNAAFLQDGYRPDRVNSEWEAYLVHGIAPGSKM
ncbi:MAG: glycosyltransferase [Lachnospiraceae bacterium]|nr:glycosyltransferase [Lachnospiraceae bacterium]